MYRKEENRLKATHLCRISCTHWSRGWRTTHFIFKWNRRKKSFIFCINQGHQPHSLFKFVSRVLSCMLKCDYPHESYWAVLSSGTVYYAAQGCSNVLRLWMKLKCCHSNESYWKVLPRGSVYYLVQGGSNFRVCGWILKCDHSYESSEQYFPVIFLITLFKVVSYFWVGGWNPKGEPFE